MVARRAARGAAARQAGMRGAAEAGLTAPRTGAGAPTRHMAAGE